MQSYFFPEITTHAELTGLCCGYVIEQAIKTNQVIDYNHIINSIDDFLADYVDDYGLVHYNPEIYNKLSTFLEGKLLLSYKININDVVKSLSSYFQNYETVF